MLTLMQSGAIADLEPDKASVWRARFARPRSFPIIGDSMQPTLSHRDFVLVTPVERFTGDGLYVVLCAGTSPDLYRCQTIGNGQISVFKDNRRYSSWKVPIPWFERNVLARAAVCCSVVDRHGYETAMRSSPTIRR